MYFYCLWILLLVPFIDGSNCSENCNEALGMEDYSIEDYQIFGGTAYDGDYASYGSQNARLHSSFGYRAEPSADTARDIIVIILNEEMVITGIATQGYGGPGVLEWVTGFYLFYTSFEGIRLPVINANGREMFFIGNADSNTIKRNDLPIPVLASTVYIKPITKHKNVGLRLELYGCKGGHYFIVWLMMKNTYFTVLYTNPTSDEYKEATKRIIYEVNDILGTTWGFLFAKVKELSPQKSPTLSTMVTAIVEIHCLRSSEQSLVAKLRSAVEKEQSIFEANFFKLQYPKRCECTPVEAELNLGRNMTSAKEIFRSKRGLMYYAIKVKQTCLQNGVFYSWQISQVDKETGYFGPMQNFGNGERLILLRNRFDLGYLYVQCIVEIRGDTNSMAYDYGYIKIVEPLIAIITDLTHQSRLSTEIKLSANQSYDSRERSMGFIGISFTWFCRLENELFPDSTVEHVVDVARGREAGHRGCYGYGPGRLTPRDVLLNLDTRNMLKSKKYIFKLLVAKDDKSASAEYEFKVRPQQVVVSVRCISNCGAKVSPQDGLSLEAICYGELCKKTSSYKWSLHLVSFSRDTFSILDVSDAGVKPSNSKNHVLINISKLHRDTARKRLYYLVKAVIHLNDHIEVEGNFSFVVNSPPQRMTSEAFCDVNPSEGEAVSTHFRIRCLGWYDEDQPLTYLFRYGGKHDMIVIQTGQLNNVSTKLPIGDPDKDYTLVLEALVGDSFKDFTITTLTVKVRPPKPSELNDQFVDHQLTTIRSFIEAGDANRATELAIMLMSAVKSLEDEMYNKMAGNILLYMIDINVTSIAHVTQVAAVVLWATEKKTTISEKIQERALTLISEATIFMMTEFNSNSTHDAKLALNVSKVLLDSLGGILQVSSRDAKQDQQNVSGQGRQLTIRAIALVRKVAEALSLIRHNHKRRTVVKSDFVDIIIYKEKPDIMAGQNFTEENGSVFVPESVMKTLPNTDDKISLQLISFQSSPYTWDARMLGIDSMVIDVIVRTKNGLQIKITNLSEPIGLYITNKRKQEPSREHRHLFLQPGIVQYHNLVIPSEEHVASLRIFNNESRRFTIYIGRGFKPNSDNYTSIAVLPDLSSCQPGLPNCSTDPHTLNLISYEPGLYYVGINLDEIQNASRVRRSCTGDDRRKRRSCVKVKDPPKTQPSTPMTITPHYDAHASVNYTFTVTIGTCLYWSEKEDKWSTRGCRVGPESEIGKVHCLCDHLTSFSGEFFVSPNPIDFRKIWIEFGRLGETKNYVVLATVCIMFGIYLIGLLFARRFDNKDKFKVITEFSLSDKESEGYLYSVSIQTGTWRKSGTTAHVGLVFYGLEDVSKPIIFAQNDLQRILFARGSVNTFTVSFEKSLGSLFKIKVWHDNSGDSPSWFLLEIVVQDIQTKEKWHFIANRWLAVEKGDGGIEMELRSASNDELLDFKNVLHSRAQKALSDSHLWVSIFTKAPHDQFTRCQRLSCCMSIIFGAMVTGAMFYRFGSKSTDVFHIGPLKMSWTEIKIGIQSGLVAIPVNFLTVTIFRNVKEASVQVSSVNCLPHFFLYIGWALCVSAIIASIMFTIFYSLTWGAETSKQWLVSMTFSFCQDVFLIQPFKVLFFVLFLSMIIRRPLSIDFMYRSSSLLLAHCPLSTGDGEKQARILQAEELENARRSRKKQVKASGAIAEIIFFLVFIILFMVVCYGNRDSVRYSLTKSIHDVFKDFSKVNSRVTFWSWMKNTFVPGVYNTRWYNGIPFDHEDGFISNRENFLVGMPRLRQVRVLPETPCEDQTRTERELRFSRCLPFYSHGKEDTTAFNRPGWVPVTNMTFLSEDILNTLCPRPWQYRNAQELNTKPIRGKMAVYSAGGYVASLGYNSKLALNVIEGLHQGNWIDDKTVAVIIECTLFEPSRSLFSVLKYVYERYPTGGVLTTSQVKTITVYLPQGSSRYRSFYQVSQVLVTLLILADGIKEIVKALRGARAYFMRFWNWVEIAFLSFSSATIAVMLYKDGYARRYVANVRANPFGNWSADRILLWSESEDYLHACVVFIFTIKTLRIVRFNRHIDQMRMTLQVSFFPLYSFSIVFIVVLLAFSSFGYWIFGSSLMEYSSLIRAVGSLLQILIGGKSSYYQLKDTSENILGPLFLFFYLLTSLTILLNVFISILNESFTTSRENIGLNGDDVDYSELCQYLWLSATSFLCRMNTVKNSAPDGIKDKRNTEVCIINVTNRNAPKTAGIATQLATMGSIDEIRYPSVSLERADELISEVLVNLPMLFEDSVESYVDYSDIDQDLEGSHFPSELEFDSYSETAFSPTSLNFHENFYRFDHLSLDISESNV